MNRTSFLAAGMLLGLIAPAPANTPALSPKDREEAQQLVGKLGHTSFKVREDAANRLVRFGRAVEPVLRQGLTSSEPEVRRRCERLIPLAIHYDLDRQIQAFLADKDEKHPVALPGWATFKAMAGADEAARTLFVDMHRIDTEYMEMIEKDPKAALTKLRAKSEEVNNTITRSWGRYPVTVDQAAFLLYPYLALAAKVDNNTRMYFTNGIQTMAYQPNGRQVLRDDPVIRKMLIAYLNLPATAYSVSNFSLIGQLDLPEGLDIARKTLKGKPDLQTRASAIALIGKLGTKANLADIEPFLTDNGAVAAVQFGNNMRIDTQVRDVALATSVQLSGQSLNDYEFPYLKMFGQQRNVQVFNSAQMFGFSDEAGRTAAFKKWHVWREKNK